MDLEEKRVCFAGHRLDIYSAKIEDKLRNVIENLILEGYTVFYDGDKGAFDKLCASCAISLKHKYPYIKIFKILTYYHPDKEKYEVSENFDGSIFPNIEEYHFKQKIIKRNEWIVDNCNVLVCRIVNEYKSGAFRMVKYAEKANKRIIYL